MKTIIEINNDFDYDVMEELRDSGVVQVEGLNLNTIYGYLEEAKAGQGDVFATNLSQDQAHVFKEFQEEEGWDFGETVDGMEEDFINYLNTYYIVELDEINEAMPKGYIVSEIIADNMSYVFIHDQAVDAQYIKDMCEGYSIYTIVVHSVSKDGTLEIEAALGGVIVQSSLTFEEQREQFLEYTLSFFNVGEDWKVWDNDCSSYIFNKEELVTVEQVITHKVSTLD